MCGHMLGTIGVKSVDDLLRPVPRELRLKEPLKIPGPLTEIELLRQVKALAAKKPFG